MTWYSNPNEVYEFAHSFNQLIGFIDIEACLYYFEKPYHWDEEYKLWNRLGRPQEHDAKGAEFVEKLYEMDGR